ncbi:MAG TPA: carboxypeptidase M32, partial [Thermoguttaceae bacterium]|nr:carboxypeptidase M32 [Thermoguttaceae bacterium]
MSHAYAKLLERIKDIGRLQAIEALLEWDQDTFMPPKGVGCRAETSALVAGLKHEWRTDPQVGELLGQCSDEDDDPVRATNIRETRRVYERAVKVPTELVKEIARTAALAKDAWGKAREASDFGAFAPALSKLLDLKRRQAEHIGYQGEPYDALLDEWEPGASTAEIARVFADLRGQLVPLVRAIADAPKKPDFSILQRHYPRSIQEDLGRKFAAEMGFDFDAGRLDVSVHPFCTSMGCQDVRFTTRYDENYLPGALFGVMHEAGHGLYEQGLDPDHAFTPMGSFISLGIHESQSRFWENQVGRSRAFWEQHFPDAQELFPDALKDVALDQFHAAVNTVTPSLIRVEADEVTYNL